MTTSSPDCTNKNISFGTRLWRIVRSFANPRFLRTWAILSCAWLVLSFLDPFGFENVTKEKSQNLIALAEAPFYGYFSDNQAQNHVAVVLLTERSLGESQTYPLPFSTHALIIKRILQQKPAGVFIDFAFTREREGDSFDYLRDEVKRRAGDIPVLFARGQAHEKLPPQLEDMGSVSGWIADEHLYPLHVEGEVDGTQVVRPTAAMDLFERLCMGSSPLAMCPGDRNPAGYNEPMVLNWGTQPPNGLDQIGQSTVCRTYGRGLLARAHEAFDLVSPYLLEGLKPLFETERQNCFYTLTIGAEQLSDPAAASLLKGRVVFYGARIKGIPDFAESPVHGLVPGVHVHAMAFDNLLTHGATYPRTAPQIMDFSFADGLEFLIWIIIAGVLAWRITTHVPDDHHAQGAAVTPRRRRAVRSMARILVQTGLVFLHVVRDYAAVPLYRSGKTILIFIGLISSIWAFNRFVLHWEVKNWIGIALLYFFTREFAENLTHTTPQTESNANAKAGAGSTAGLPDGKPGAG